MKGRLLRWLSACLLLPFAPVGLAASPANLPDFTALVERQGAAVVNVSTSQTRQASPSVPRGLDENDPMFDFFRRFVPRHPRTPELDPENRSLGTGFIISADGYILTNAHVVDEAEEILVRLADKREFVATVVGADARSDVALIKIEAAGLPKVVLGDPGRLKVGEWVLAIGSPFGFEQTVTAGIVSAKGRSLPDENFVPFIQTDVAINPGNSGGPLFNLRGEVVGINSQIYSQTGGFMGLSFSIPIDVAMDVQQQLRAHGRVQRGRIGVAIQEVSRELAESFSLPRAAGALVSGVEAGGPAGQAGVEQGDVIVRFDGKSVEASTDLPRIVSASRPGGRVAMQLFRQGALREVTVTVGEWRDSAEPVKKPVVAARASTINSLGLQLVAPTGAQRREQGVEHGLLVERVAGPAARAELRPGDLVLALVSNGRQSALRSLEDFSRQLTTFKPGQQITLLVKRGEATSYVSVRAEK
ncbi:Do family serine endopeptidase [Azoarcus olearius]|uniref:Probable periplasmic serine endoprotease DegP-like n=1 Tax=Azoarcus sp. (strain BH72) TaxID=418699 RepID=A1K5Z6_AZOSB|nr:Do family serine endopeptidase [Azoarcus olearius]ANQ84801.1 serine protease MucD [Azoarcus olearius]CAL94251.1 probable serine protease MucD [Azoarcus olearius]